MNTRALITLGILLLVVSCGKRNEENQSSGNTLFCTTSGTVSSGNVNLANSQVQVSNLYIYIYNGTSGGTYTVTLPDGSTTTTASTSYTYPGTLTLTTGASGGISSQVTVLDSAAGTSASCVLGISTTTTGTSTTTNSSTGTGSTGASVTLTASPAAAVSSGSISLLATSSGITNPVYTFYYANGNTLGVVGTFNGASATLASYNAGSIAVGVQAQSATNASMWARTELTITFGSSTGTGTYTLNCTLSHLTGYYYRGQNVPFYLTSDTGEPLQITYWDAGEPWDYGGPSLPISLMPNTYFYAAYGVSGTKSVRILAQSAVRSGAVCNGGAYLTDSLVIY